MKLGELAQRLVPARRRRARFGEPPRTIVPVAGPDREADWPARQPADPFDAARERLKSRIPPPDDDLE